MLKGILTFILKLVDVKITLDGDILGIELKLGAITVLVMAIDLVKDKEIKTKAEVKSVKVSRAHEKYRTDI